MAQIPPYLTAKDLILAVIGEIGVDGATYRSMYFAGEGISSLTLEDRMTLTNMAIEAGGKNGVCDVDEKTLQYVRNRSKIPNWEVFSDDPNAEYCLRGRMGSGDAGAAGRQAALARTTSDTAHNCRDVKLDQAYIGSCTGGKITDMIFAANILKGNQGEDSDLRRARQHRSPCRHEAAESPRRGKRPQRKKHRRRAARCRLQRRRQRLLGLSRRPARHFRPPATQPKSASARPTAISPAAWEAPRAAVYLASAPDRRRQRPDRPCD